MRVAALYAYPVKACRGHALQSATLDALGFEGDRRFAFVLPGGTTLTQRDQPLLATISPEVDARELRLDLGGLQRLAVRLADFSSGMVVDVWGNRVEARAAPREATGPVADYLGIELRLVALAPAARRGFADSEPVLVATTGMLASLNGKLSSPVGMERFRPNVVLEGDDADWRTLRATEVLLERAKPCGRCEVTTIDQASGARRGDEPLRTLNERFDGNFGIYCRVSRTGRLRVGETLQPA